MFSTLVVSLLLLVSLVASSAEAVEFHGFAIESYDSKTKEVSAHFRLIFQEQAADKLTIRLTLTPEGPLDTITYYEVTWSQPAKGINYVTAGRTFPPFGREWFLYRADEVPTLTYSESNDPLSVTDTGLTIHGRGPHIKWWMGAYSGDRTFGNERRYEGRGNLYARVEYALTHQLEVGSSYRFGPCEASGLDLFYRHGALTGIAELVRSVGESQYAFIGMLDAGRSGLVMRSELLSFGTRWTVAVPYRFTKQADFRIGYVFGAGQQEQVIAKLAARW